MKEARKTEALMYTVQIYQYFQAKCGKPGALTLDEWSCIQQWREQGLQVESILRGIDLAFRGKDTQISSLVHCAKAVRDVSKLPS